VPTPTPAPEFRRLQKGDSGEDVARLQKRLIELGYMDGEVSGVFDDATVLAIERYQRQNMYAINGRATSLLQREILGDKAQRYIPKATATPKPTVTPKPTPKPTATPKSTPRVTPLPYNSIGSYTGGYKTYASSTRSNNNPPVDSSKAMDGKLNTAWNSHERSSGVDFEISVTNGREYMIGGVRIAPGYWRDSEVFYGNARPKEVAIYCDGAYVTTATLSSSKDYQLVWFDEPVVGTKITIRINSSYRDAGAYYDTCISEIELVGPYGQSLNPDYIDDWGSSVRKLRESVERGIILYNGSRGMEVVGLQLLLRDGFGVLSGNVDGSFGPGTERAVIELANRMKEAMPDCEPMSQGVVDEAYWSNLLRYMEIIGG